jgi:tetratricopeptide (TPR) repeat protein
MKAGRAILASRVYMHAPLSSQKFDKLTAQRAHLRARQGAEVGGEVQSLIVALGPELYADLCTQVGYFLVEVGAEDERARALLIAKNALDAQRMMPAVRRSRRLSRKVQFNDDAVARLAWIAVRAANNQQDRGKYARMMLKYAPNSSYVWQLLISEPALQSTLLTLVGDVERRANARPPTPASAVPFTARGLYLLKQNHAVHAISAFDNALQRQPHATLPALLLAVAAVRQASATAAHSDTLAQAMSSLYHYASLRLEPSPEHGAESILPDDLRRAEVSYNFGRALHSLGWFDQAEAFYLGAINALRGDSHELFVRIAAHNLSLLYEQRGERTLAAAVVQQYMKFF